MEQEAWQKALYSLNKRELTMVTCRLLGRSGISDEDFIQMCKEMIGK
jgi:hypothetical protein